MTEARGGEGRGGWREIMDSVFSLEASVGTRDRVEYYALCEGECFRWSSDCIKSFMLHLLINEKFIMC